jgi:hypothetical protein
LGSSIYRPVAVLDVCYMLLISSRLACAETYLVLAARFRRFNFERYEMDVSDIPLAPDFFLPSPKLDTKDSRAKVKAVDWSRCDPSMPVSEAVFGGTTRPTAYLDHFSLWNISFVSPAGFLTPSYPFISCFKCLATAPGHDTRAGRISGGRF